MMLQIDYISMRRCSVFTTYSEDQHHATCCGVGVLNCADLIHYNAETLG
jgi:hypothetical protein